MLNLKDIKKDISSGKIFLWIGGVFSRNLKKLVFLLFFFLAGYCGYLWYVYVYAPRWSEDKRAQYLSTKDKDVIFNRKKFQNIVDEAQKRAEEYVKIVDQPNDIFRINQLPVPPQSQQPELQQQAQTQPAQ
ncbi:MAG: hypothetical protein WC848_00480 [Parcubacteria group bacterium]